MIITVLPNCSRNSHMEATILNDLNEKLKSCSSIKRNHPQIEQEQESKFRRSTLTQFKIAGACYILSLACGMSACHSSTLMRDLTSTQSSIATDKGTALWIDHGPGKEHQVIIVEFTDSAIRGPLMTGCHIFLILGSVLAYALALVLNWRIILGVTGILPLLAILAFHFQKESAIWLMRKFRMIEARRSLLWIFGPGKEHQAEIVHEEMVQRQRSEETENFRRFAGYSNTTFGAAPVKYWKIYTSSHTIKPFLITLVINATHIFFGTHLFVKLALHTFNNKEINEEAEKFSVLLLTQVLRLPGLLASIVLLHWLHRRSIFISSGIASSIFSLAIGIISYLSKPTPSQTERWVIIILIIFYVTSDSWGFYILTNISTAELIPGKTRGILCGFVYAVNGILMCIILSANGDIFNILANHELFWIFTIFCLVCTTYVYLFLPETRGKTLANIEDYFKTCSVLWISRHYKQSHRTTMEVNLNEMAVFNKEQQV
ncbi:hypothetical protein C0J52_14180 [Blattella germanica]|nr:hypothetical protein C0J52_14180 [Blattella germanica]